MDSTMQDVESISAPPVPSAPLEPTTIPTLDGWIESLMTCKQLAEQDVQRLCDKVCKLSAPSRARCSVCVGR
jgi:hypothetical protein